MSFGDGMRMSAPEKGAIVVGIGESTTASSRGSKLTSKIAATVCSSNSKFLI